MLQRERKITLRFLAEPADLNFEGMVRGGAVMKWLAQYRVTVYVGAIRFYKLVLIDNVVEVSAGDPRETRLIKTRRCVIVFVALNETGVSR